VLAAGNEVNEALVKYQTCEQKSKLYDKQVEALTRAMNSTQLTMQHGSTTYLEVLNAQNTLLNAQLTQIANQTEQNLAVVKLYHALGGGKE
jgi:outer membrane protein TolC